MTSVYFKTDTSGPVRFFCTSDGKIDFSVLGRKFGINPESIELNSAEFPKEGLKSELKWETIEEAFKEDGLPVGTKEDPVIVTGEAPVSKGLFPFVPEKLLQDLIEYLAEQKAKSKSKKSVQISSVDQYIWGTIQRQVGLKMMQSEIDLNPEHLSDLPAFGWDDRLERLQADRYIPHLNKIASGRKWVLIDAANNHPTLLSGSLGGWNFKGTTDVAFVRRTALKTDPRLGLKCIFELNKDLRVGPDKAVIQITIGLVMANFYVQQFKPFAVLTDLDEIWSLYWMDGPKICSYAFESRASAVGYIEELLRDSDNDEMGTDNDEMGTSEALTTHVHPDPMKRRMYEPPETHAHPDPKKRRMYEPPEMGYLKDFVGLIPDEDILSARVQLSVQQLEKLPLFSGVPDVVVPWPQSMYC